jgi:hypothetical protein
VKPIIGIKDGGMMVVIKTKNVCRNIEKFHKSSEKKTHKLSALLKTTVIRILEMLKLTYKIKEKCYHNYYIVRIKNELVTKAKLRIINKKRKPVVLKLKE